MHATRPMRTNAQLDQRTMLPQCTVAQCNVQCTVSTNVVEHSMLNQLYGSPWTPGRKTWFWCLVAPQGVAWITAALPCALFLDSASVNCTHKLFLRGLGLAEWDSQRVCLDCFWRAPKELVHIVSVDFSLVAVRCCKCLADLFKMLGTNGTARASRSFVRGSMHGPRSAHVRTRSQHRAAQPHSQPHSLGFLQPLMWFTDSTTPVKSRISFSKLFKHPEVGEPDCMTFWARHSKSLDHTLSTFRCVLWSWKLRARILPLSSPRDKRSRGDMA